MGFYGVQGNKKTRKGLPACFTVVWAILMIKAVWDGVNVSLCIVEGLSIRCCACVLKL